MSASVRTPLIVVSLVLIAGSTTVIGLAAVFTDTSNAVGIGLVVTWVALAVAATGWLIGSRLDQEAAGRDRRVADAARLGEARADERWASVQDLAHELRNPLAVMATTIDVALGDERATTADLRQAAAVVRRTVDRAAHAVDDLIVFARNETPEARRSEVDLGRLLGDVLAEHQGPIDSQKLVVERVLGPAIVSVDREAIKRAVANLVGNAVRLSRPHSVLRVGAGVHGEFAWIGVDDQGPGLDPREHDLVFQRFWTHDEGSLNGEARSGLGLAITRQVAEQHGGTVTLRSELGAGAEFVIWLPVGGRADLAAVTRDGIHPRWSPLLWTESLTSA
jgi:signal transduction histidine kinase